MTADDLELNRVFPVEFLGAQCWGIGIDNKPLPMVFADKTEARWVLRDLLIYRATGKAPEIAGTHDQKPSRLMRYFEIGAQDVRQAKEKG